MKKLIILFLITFTTELFPQTWDFLYKEDFLVYNETFESYGKMNCKQMFIRGDSTYIFRVNSDTLLMIYDQSKKKWFYKSRRDLLVNNTNKDSIYKEHKKSNVYYIAIDNEKNIWLSIGNSILQIKSDTIVNFTQYFDNIRKKYYKIDRTSQKTFDIKVDINGDIWLLAQFFVLYNDTTYFNYYALCKFKNNRLETMFDRQINRFYIDRMNKIWCCFGDSVFIYENDIQINQFSTYDFPNGYGYLKDVVFDSKNTMYALNTNSYLYIYDGENFKSDKYMHDIEWYSGTHEDLSSSWLSVDSSDNIWLIGSMTCNLYKLASSANWSLIEIPKFSTAVDDWCYKSLIQCDNYNNIWISAQSNYYGFGVNNYGIYIFNPDTTTGVVEQGDFSINGLPDVWLFNLYPNPATQNVTVEFFLDNSVVEQLDARLFNVMGMEVKNIKEDFDYDSYNMKATLKFSVAGIPRGGHIVSVKAGRSHKFWMLMVGY